MITPAHPLTVLQASCHGPSLTHRAIRYALSREFSACVVNFSEAYRHEAFLYDRPSWRVTLPVIREGDDRDVVRGKGDAPVVVRRHHHLLDSWSMKACSRSVPLKIAPPRWFNGQTFDHELGAVEAMAAHPNAAIRGLPEGLDRVEKYAQSMRLLELRIEDSLHRGRLPVVTGDLNYPDVDGPPWCPSRMFARLGLKTWAVGVDWIAYSPRLVPIRNRIIGQAQTGQDHPWLHASFTGFRK